MMLKLKRCEFFSLKSIRFYLSMFLLITLLTGCPSNHEKKEAREIYQNKMNFNFNDYFKINFNGLYFKLPKKFKGNYTNYQSMCTNGSDCRSYSFENLSLFFGISEIKQEEQSKIRFIHNLSNPLDAILQDAALKRKESIFSLGRISEITSIKSNFPCKMLTVTEPFQKTYSWEDDYTSLYYIAAIEINNRHYVIQLCGKRDKMIYFLDDFKRILRSMN
jgi:hypothetical protein